MILPGKVQTPRAWPDAPVPNDTQRTVTASSPKPCPFCGSKTADVQELDVNSFGVVCLSCSAIGPFVTGQGPLTAIARWNLRPGEDLLWMDEALNSGDGVYRP